MNLSNAAQSHPVLFPLFKSSPFLSYRVLHNSVLIICLTLRYPRRSSVTKHIGCLLSALFMRGNTIFLFWLTMVEHILSTLKVCRTLLVELGLVSLTHCV